MERNTGRLKAEFGKAFSRCHPLVLALVLCHVLCWLAGSPRSPCRAQLGRIHGRLTSVTTGLWGGFVVAFLLALVYERRRGSRGAEPDAEQREAQEAREREKNTAHKRLLDACRELIEQHAQTLSRKRRELTQVDDYGVVDRTQWDAEKAYFQDKVLFANTEWEADAARVRKGLWGERLSSEDLAAVDTLIEESLDRLEKAEALCA